MTNTDVIGYDMKTRQTAPCKAYGDGLSNIQMLLRR